MEGKKAPKWTPVVSSLFKVEHEFTKYSYPKKAQLSCEDILDLNEILDGI